jgi:low temperature requirement protein LtrA
MLLHLFWLWNKTCWFLYFSNLLVAYDAYLVVTLLFLVHYAVAAKLQDKDF